MRQDDRPLRAGAERAHRARSQCSVTLKLTHLLKRADEVWPVALGQWELAILAWIQAEERMEAVEFFLTQSSTKSTPELALKWLPGGDKG